MGRWAQRRRGGGGGGPDTVISMIELVEGGSPLELAITYNKPINSADFAGADFETDVTAQNADGIAQDTPTRLLLTFALSTSLDTAITFTGLVTNVTTPQTIAKT